MPFSERIILNSNGSALVMVLILIIAASAFSLGFVERAKLQSLISARQQVDGDLNKIMSVIGGLATTPANCNANFSTGDNSTGHLDFMKSCISGNCRPGASNIVLTKYPNGPDQPWSSSMDYANTLSYSNNISSKIRIVALDYSISVGDEQTDSSNPAYLTMAVTFEIKLSPSSKVKTLPKRYVRFPVAVAANNTTTTTILGCPKFPGTTTLY